MTWLKTNLPVLFSPTFWGLTFAAIFRLGALHGWLPEADLDIISNWLIGVTGVNIIWKAATKNATPKT